MKNNNELAPNVQLKTRSVLRTYKQAPTANAKITSRKQFKKYYQYMIAEYLFSFPKFNPATLYPEFSYYYSALFHPPLHNLTPGLPKPGLG
jgi:hypothetical protein